MWRSPLAMRWPFKSPAPDCNSTTFSSTRGSGMESTSAAAGTFRIAVLPGDGIGPEVIAEALRILQAATADARSLRLEFQEYPAGADEYLRNGDALPAATLSACHGADAIL